MPQDRYSDSSQANAASANRFFVWSQDSTQFDHEELAENWDRLDAMLGRPSGGGQWPPDEGVGNGIYKQIKLLQQDRESIGTIKAWWYPFSPGDNQATIEAKVAQYNPGWVLCDGGRIGPAESNPLRQSHDFTGAASTIYVPDLRHQFIMGASTAIAAGTTGNASPSTPGTSLNTNTNAPGIVTTSVSGNAYSIGGNYQRIQHTQGGHDHYIEHSHVIPAFSTNTFGPDRSGYTQFADFQQTNYANISGSSQHRHGLQMEYRGDNGQASSNTHIHYMTVPQHGTWGMAGGGPYGNQRSEVAGGFSIDQSHDNRPKSVGLLYIIKIKHQTVVT